MSEIMQLKQKKELRLQAMEDIEKEIHEQLAAKAQFMMKQETEIEKKPEVDEQQPWDPLVWTRVPFGGVLNEFKQRLPVLKSDITDAMNLMCLAAIIFIFCSALSGAVAFGGLLGKWGQRVLFYQILRYRANYASQIYHTRSVIPKVCSADH